MSQPADSDPGGTHTPGLADLFTAFSGIALMGFGGVLPWARRMMVEQKGWLNPEEFAELLSLCQFLPGGNIINLAIVVGQRTNGLLGSIVAVSGLMVVPVVLVLLLGSLYLHYGHLPEVHAALAGMAAAAAGLIMSMAAKMARPLFRRGGEITLGFAVLAFIGVAVLQFSLPAVVIVLAPISVAVAWRRPT